MKQKGTIAKRLAPKMVKSVIVNQDRTRAVEIKEHIVKEVPNQLKLF